MENIKNNKKTKFLAIIMLLVMMCCSFLLSGCFGNPSVPVKFGEFGYNGRYLTAFATQTILPSQAKQILSNNMGGINTLSAKTLAASASVDPTPDQTLIDFVLAQYSGCQITTKFYVEGSEDQLTKSDYLIGTDLKSMLEENKFTPFSQLVAKYVLCFPNLIDNMEQLNAEFRASQESIVAPFANIFTYHTNEKGELVIQTRDFAEIPSSVGGGIASSYRQDTEILYDAQNKIQKWQTSLGLYSATPQGTMKQGYILEVEFNWELKK